MVGGPAFEELPSRGTGLHFVQSNRDCDCGGRRESVSISLGKGISDIGCAEACNRRWLCHHQIDHSIRTGATLTNLESRVDPIWQLFVQEWNLYYKKLQFPLSWLATQRYTLPFPHSLLLLLSVLGGFVIRLSLAGSTHGQLAGRPFVMRMDGRRPLDG